MDIQVGDIIEMKKTHPCGEKSFQVQRIGSDIKVKCLTCSREVIIPRVKLEKNIKKINRPT